MLERSGVAIGEWVENASPGIDMLCIDMACALAEAEIGQRLV
jgi:hypothetical protein